MLIKSYEEILKNEEKYIIVDVRTPNEFNDSTIPGAINIPVLNNEERADVGTIYKQIGKKQAVIKAMDYVGPKLSKLYQEFDKLYKRDVSIVLFCARGGMRSGILTSVLKSFSLPVVKLESGYKGYRKYVNDNLPLLFAEKKFITLYGKTGVGKTKILMALKDKSYDILDLEGCANHRGSLLGGVGLSCQTSQKMFESLVFDALRKSSKPYIFVEGESRRIGKIMMPQYIYTTITTSKLLNIETSLENRVNIIAEEYIQDNVDYDGIKSSLEKLRRYISEERIEKYLHLVSENKFNEVIEELIVKYYDISYREKNKNFDFEINYETIEKCVVELESFYKKLN